MTRSNESSGGLFVASCSITTTRRRRFLWAAWWTAPPARLPFRKPDAFAGGARSHDEALAQARAAAGMPLVVIEPRWARAWSRVTIGQSPWGARAAGGSSSARGRAGGPSPPVVGAGTSIWEILGTTARATATELKRAFHQRALATHPRNRGGNPEEFRAVQTAFEEAQRRLARRGPERQAPGNKKPRAKAPRAKAPR